MFEPARMNHIRSAQSQMPYNRNPFSLQNTRQASLNRSPMNLTGFTPRNTQAPSLLSKGLVSKGLGGFANILDNVQQVLRVVETTAPIIQEYGPMVKNLPAMYRMVKAFKSIDGLDEEDAHMESAENNNEGTEIEDTEIETKDEKLAAENELEKNQINKVNDGRSIPKLYI